MSNLSKTAKTVLFTTTGGPEVLKIENVEIPAPGAQEVRMQIKAIGINRADAMYREGNYVEQPVFPAKLGYEASGIIDAVGDDVTGFAIGDVVSIVPAFSLNSYATYGELIVVPAYTLQKHPSSLSFEEAASIWTSFISMYGLLVDAARIKAGQTVIITAASSSAGLAAIQFTNLMGGISIAITSSPGKREALLNAGAKHVIVSAEQDIVAEINEITANKGVDIILDPVGGPMFSKLIAVAAERAQVFVYGAMSTEQAVFPTLAVLTKLPTIKGYSAADVLSNPSISQEAIKFINKGIQEGKLKPVIAKTFSLDEIGAAHRYMELNTHFGKIVVTV